jgi:hypothetical protein
MPAFHRAALEAFITASDSELTGILSLAYASHGFTDQKSQQTLAWAHDLFRLRESLTNLHALKPETRLWTVLLEFNIPRKLRRIDVVLLTPDTIILLEQKSHAPTSEDALQVEEYALLLHYFHAPSHRRRILPILISPTPSPGKSPPQRELPFRETAAFWIDPVIRLNWPQLAPYLSRIGPSPDSAPIDPTLWESGEYRPVPTIIEAALSLQSGLSDIREIAHSSAARHDIDQLTHYVQQRVDEARTNSLFTICFVTGVPGSGKTLVGLNLAFTRQASTDTIHFMSGNGPLVKVLQTVLARYQMARGVRALDARHHAQTLVENVHVFARTYTDDPQHRAPSNHVVIFDEAQRAWDKAQNLAKFKRPYSEPEMLLQIMERHHDWAVVIALVGGGQEINTGEAASKSGATPSPTPPANGPSTPPPKPSTAETP